jgi:predicted transcriptional regulator
MNNIVKLAPNTEKPNYTKRLRNADDAMQTLRMEIYAWDHKELAKAIGVSPSCIMAIRSGRTKWPRPKTFFGLLDALELDMLLVKRV